MGLSHQIYGRHIRQNWFALNEKIRFLIIALANNVFRYAAFVFLIFLFGAHIYQFNLFLAWMVSVVTAFVALKYLVFETKGNHVKEFLRSAATLAAGYVLNAILLWLFVKVFNFNIIFAQALALSLIVINNYILFRHFAFNDAKIGLFDKFLSIFK